MGHRPNFLKRLLGASQTEDAETSAETVEPDVEVTPRTNTPNAIPTPEAKYQIGQVVRHRLFDFRGVIFDVDPVFANTDEWYEAIPEEVRPAKNQPYYHLFAENDRTHYVAYVSEQNLRADETNSRVMHPDIPNMFEMTDNGYVLKSVQRN